MSESMKVLFDECVAVASKALKAKGHTNLNPVAQVTNIFAHATTNSAFSGILRSESKRVHSVLKDQIKYLCELGLDTAKGRKLVYVLTRNVNVGTKQEPKWFVMPDIQDSYHALIHVLVRSNALKSISVIHTYQNYEIEYTGDISDIPVVKSWATAPDSRGAYTGLFVILAMQDGETLTSYHHSADLYATHRQFSKSSSVWKNHNNAMCAKSAILDAVKYIPVFDDVVAAIIEHHDESMDYDLKDEKPIESVAEIKRDSVEEEPEPETIELPAYPDENFDNNIDKWLRLISKGIKTPEAIINTVCTMYTLTDDQIAEIKGEKK